MPATQPPLAPTEMQVLLVLAQGPLYGYAMLQALEQESGGAVQPDIGSLYRTLGRLLERGLVADAGEREPERGKPRRYYRLTPRGRSLLRAELERLAGVISLARRRSLLPDTAGD